MLNIMKVFFLIIIGKIQYTKYNFIQNTTGNGVVFKVLV